MVQRVVSPGGIEAWLVEDYAVPLVALDFAFVGGAAQDPADRAGLTQMMASLLDEGAGPLDDEAFQLRMEENAVELSFHVGRDQLNGSLRTLASKREEGFELMRLALNEPRFEAGPVERIRQGLLSGLRREGTDPNAMSGKALFSALFPDHPYGRSTRGSVESVTAIAADEIRAQHRRLVARDVLKVTAVGAIDAATLVAMLDRVFGALPARAELTAVPDVDPQAFGQRRTLDLAVPQSTIQLATPGVRRDDPDFLPAFVMNHILGGGAFSSWLYQKVREERGLAYSVHTQLASFQHAALVTGWVATRNDRAAESVSIIEGEIARMAGEGPGEEEFASAKRYLVGSYPLRFDTSTKIANQLTQIQIEGLGIDYVDRRNALVEAVTLDDVRRVSRRLFAGPAPLVVAVGQPVGLGAAVAAAA